MAKVEKHGDFIPAKRLAKVSPEEAVRMLRELHDMTQNDLSKETGIPQPVLSAIENDSATLGLERAKKLARALKVHPAVLLFADWSEDDSSVRPAVAAGRRSKRKQPKWPIGPVVSRVVADGYAGAAFEI